MAEQLSQDEIDALREAVKSGDAFDGAADENSDEVSQVKVASYNFRKPRLMSDEQMHVLQLLNDSFCKGIEQEIGSLLKSPCEVKLVAIDQINYSEFVLSLSSPSCVYIAGTAPNIGHMALEINLSIVMPVIDILLGGSGKTEEEPRELTPIEINIFQAMTDTVFSEMKNAWKMLGEVTFNIARHECNPEFVQLASSEVTCMTSTFDVHIGDINGVITACYPFELMQKAFALKYGTGGEHAAGGAVDPGGKMLRALSASPLDISAIVGDAVMSAEQLGNLSVGDIVCLGREIEEDVDVFVDRQKAFTAKVGQRKGRAAVVLSRDYLPGPANDGAAETNPN